MEINEARKDEARATAQDGAVSAKTAGAASAVSGSVPGLEEQKAAVAIRRSILAVLPNRAAGSANARRGTTRTEQNVARNGGRDLCWGRGAAGAP